ALAEIAGNTDHDRIRHTGSDGYILAWLVDHQGHAATSDRSAGQRHQERLSEPRCAAAAGDAWPGDLSARPAKPGGACRLSQGGDRQMVANHQGRRNQSRMKL